MMTGDWRAYFDRLEHASPLYRAQSGLYLQALAAEVGLSHDERVLDFGCGFGNVAALLAARVAEVWWWDPSPNMRAVAGRATAGFPNTRYADLSAGPPADPAAGWNGPPLDLILVNSVAQYMPPAELTAWLHGWRRMLADDGAVVLSDLIPPGHRGLSDVIDLLRLGGRHGSPLGAARESLGGLRRYWRTTRTMPLVRIGTDDLRRRADDAGLEVTELPRNLTHFSKRWAAVLRPRVS